MVTKPWSSINMNWEIEIKAWVDDLEILEQRILDIGGQFKRSYQKLDEYYEVKPRHVEPGQRKIQEFRLRLDGAQALVTFKDKELRGGLEMNREGEFTVDNPEMFQTLIRRLGARLKIKKKKVGKSFDYKGFLLELSEVCGLGFFIEIEAVFHGDQKKQDPDFIEATEKGLYALLEELGISRDKIEKRPYTSMLEAEKKRE